MLAVQLTENGNLLLDIVNFVLCILEIYNLDGHRLASNFGEAFVDLAEKEK
jgi:hypothetical protein